MVMLMVIMLLLAAPLMVVNLIYSALELRKDGRGQLCTLCNDRRLFL